PEGYPSHTVHLPDRRSGTGCPPPQSPAAVLVLVRLPRLPWPWCPPPGFLIYLVNLVHLVQPNNRDKPKQPALSTLRLTAPVLPTSPTPDVENESDRAVAENRRPCHPIDL